MKFFVSAIFISEVFVSATFASVDFASAAFARDERTIEGLQAELRPVHQAFDALNHDDGMSALRAALVFECLDEYALHWKTLS